MATRVIFSGDVTVSLNTSPRQFRLVNADFSLEDVENTPEMILNINGFSKSFSYSGLYPYDSNRYYWVTQGTQVAFTYYISSGLLAIVDPAFEMSNTINVEVIADISKKEDNVITYSASQNGGSIYDNLKELYSSVTGEDAKGHNPSEVIDELKGKLGGGSADGGVTTYWALINTPNSVYGSGDNVSKAYQIWEFDPEKPIDMVTNPKGITDSEINESFLNGTVIVKCIDYSVYASKQKIAVGNIVKLASKFEDYDLTGEPTGTNIYIGLMYDRTSSTLVTKYFMRSTSSETEANT